MARATAGGGALKEPLAFVRRALDVLGVVGREDARRVDEGLSSHTPKRFRALDRQHAQVTQSGRALLNAH
eukprot:5690822-Lingulodinium_polyedra.AAC.1